MFQLPTRAVRAAVGVSTLALAFAATPAIEAQKAPSQITPNYDLASAWTTQRVSKLVFRSNNLTHSKLVIDRDVEAVVLGSPFGQVYFDSHHALDDPRRGADASKGPIHEMSASVRGGTLPNSSSRCRSS